MFYGQFEPPQDKYLYDALLNYENGVSIEAGASNGILENNTYFFEKNLNWKTINIEPLPAWYEELTINRPNSININCCLHPYLSGAPVDFYCPNIVFYGNKNHLGSLNLTNLNKTHNPNIISKIKCNTITFNDVVKKCNLDRLDLFVLDIEGYELEFLKTFNAWSLYPKVFVIEIGHIDESAINSLISHKYEFFGNHFVNNIYVRK
jgi:FkbM family methyltransferase